MSFVGAAWANLTTAGTSITVSAGLPTILANDVAIIVASGQSATAKTFPTGFTSTFSGLSQLVPSSPASSERADIRYGICAGGENSFQISGGSGLWTALVLIYRGRNTNALVTATAQTAIVAAASFPISAVYTAGITPAAGDDVVLISPTGGFQSGTPAIGFSPVPSSFADGQSTGTTTNSVGTILSCDYPSYPGGALPSTLTATLTGPTGGGQTCGYGGWLVALAATPAGSVSEALTNQGITTVVGTPGLAPSYALTGQSSTTNEGTITASFGSAYTAGAQSITSAMGTILSSSVFSPQILTLAQGTITAVAGGNVTDAVSAQSASLIEAALGLNVQYVLDSNLILLSGQAVAFAQGAVLSVINASLTAQTISSAEGTPSEATACVLSALTSGSSEGVIISSGSGNNVSLSLLPLALSSIEGIIANVPSYALAAQSSTSASGTMTYGLAPNLTIIQGVFFAGTMVPLGGANASLFMPNVIGLSQAQAMTILNAIGGLFTSAVFQNEVYPYEPLPPGFIMNTIPAAGTTITQTPFPYELICSTGFIFYPDLGESVKNFPNVVIGDDTPP